LRSNNFLLTQDSKSKFRSKNSQIKGSYYFKTHLKPQVLKLFHQFWIKIMIFVNWLKNHCVLD